MISSLILDSAAFIMNSHLEVYGNIHYYITANVVQEIRDVKARERYNNFPFTITIKQVDQEVLKIVTLFAKLTGDLAVLSNTDLEVIALAYQIEKEVNGMENLRTEPPKLPTFNGDEMNGNVAIESNNEMNNQEEDGWETVPSKKNTHSHKSEVVPEPIETKEEEEEEEEVEFDENDQEEDDYDGEWINADNLHHTHLLDSNTVSSLPVTNSSVAVITTDFALQNVLLQLGIRLISINGTRITRIQKTIKRCYGCMRVEKDSSKIFCSFCGGSTLARVFIVVDNGEVSYKQSFRETFNKRGTKYTIPKPKGKHDLPFLLREDQLMMGKYKIMMKKKVKNLDFFDDRDIITEKSSSTINFNPVVGYGKKNPNAGRKKN